MSEPKAAARAAQDSTAFRVVARIGYVVLGILHIVIGVIAISVATGGGGEADQGGAMEQIQRSPAGVFLLWAIVVGLAALAIWQIAEAVLERDPDTKKKWGYRLKYLGTAAAYVAIAITALVYALGGQSDSSQSSTSMSAQLMATTAGVILLVFIGLVIAAVGIAFIVRGLTRAFEKHLALPAGGARRGIVAFGVVGYVAKGVAIAVTGVLFVVAAITRAPETAGGLDAALHALAVLPFGVFILWIVGAGLVVYGLFCFARARYARM
ncbi:MAG TPA: DUF1206 domain-containing protein [Microbacterium sp.]|uniref:DUF1206 domain-containing protein n=1 Tax=Microbacterium sp. TaxID=51671 RepID=UPI002B6C754E|nr:DUF1206 domain-containing protein [Microbacterium sp.]HWI30770.1 DUF1206 domain-containing protein [Microbacterium sp.]